MSDMSEFTGKQTVLHVGCGTARLPALFPPEQWREIRLDIDPGVQPDILASLTDMSQLADASVDALWSSHNLEHLQAHEVAGALGEFRRVLRGGGHAFILTPDIQAVAEAVAQGNLEEPLYTSPAGPVSALDMLWGHAASLRAGQVYMAHRTGFTADTLLQKLKDAGFAAAKVERRPAAFELFATVQKEVTDAQIEDWMRQAADHQTAQRWRQAEAIYRRLVFFRERHWPAWYELGVSCYAQQALPEAIECMRKAAALAPHFANAHRALGCFLGMAGHAEEAIAALRHGISLDSNSAETHYNLGKALQEQNHLALAEQSYREALRIDPGYVLAHLNLGQVLNLQGDGEQAFRSYRAALALDPHSAWMHSNIALLMNFLEGHDSAEVFAAHQEFERMQMQPLAASIRPHANLPDPGRRLRLGYVSGDFRTHSLRYFITPILARHDHAQYEVYCYQTSELSDEVTARLRGFADHWLECAGVGFGDAELAERIRQDRIDILVDLSGHTQYNRLPVFGRKPAPVQITYLGYPSSTGVAALDYRIGDGWIDPEPADPQIFSSEHPLRLRHGFFCYQPLAESPEVNALPALERGFVTFGCLSQYPKLNQTLLSWWAEILRQVPGAKLLLQNQPLQTQPVRERLLRQFAALGVDESRLIFGPFGKAPDYLRTYHGIDIALDSYPYNGGTTTCEALWMGVPVVSLQGKRQVSRLGLSILAGLGLGEWVAASPEQYIQTALDLACDLPRLQAFRASLRQRMAASPTMDAEGFVRELEAAYRQAWQAWCGRHRPAAAA